MNATDVLNRIADARRSQRETVRYVLRQAEPIGTRLQYCGSWLHLREWIETGESRIQNANFCKQHLLCRCCAARRAGKLVEAYAVKVDQVCADYAKAHPGCELVPAMVTLTVKNGPDLRERMQHLKGAWSTMIERRRRHKSRPNRNPHVEWCKVHGSIKSLEVTQGKGGWHPHFHAFVLLESYIDQAQLSKEWESITADSFVVGVTKCHGGIVAGLVECLKYATKFSELSPAQAWEVHKALKGSRTVDPQGCLRGVPEPEIDQDDNEGLSGPYRDLIAWWSWERNGYVVQPAEHYGLDDVAGQLSQLEDAQVASYSASLAPDDPF